MSHGERLAAQHGADVVAHLLADHQASRDGVDSLVWTTGINVDLSQVVQCGTHAMRLPGPLPPVDRGPHGCHALSGMAGPILTYAEWPEGIADQPDVAGVSGQ